MYSTKRGSNTRSGQKKILTIRWYFFGHIIHSDLVLVVKRLRSGVLVTSARAYRSREVEKRFPWSCGCWMLTWCRWSYYFLWCSQVVLSRLFYHNHLTKKRKEILEFGSFVFFSPEMYFYLVGTWRQLHSIYCSPEVYFLCSS